MATPLVPLKIEMAYFKSPTQKPDFSCEKFLEFLHRMEISTILIYFCLNSVAMATPLVALKIRIAYWNSPAPKSPLYMGKISRFLAQKWWVHFCPNLVAMTTALTPMKFYIPYLNAPTPKNFKLRDKFLDFLHSNEISDFDLFLPKFGCHGNSLDYLEILDSVFEFADPEYPTIHGKIVSISCTQNNEVIPI